MYKLLVKETDYDAEEMKFVTLNAEIINGQYAIYFNGNWLVMQKAFKTDQSFDTYVVDETSKYILLATDVNVVNEADLLNDAKELIQNRQFSFYDFLTKYYQSNDEGSLNLIEAGGYRVKPFK